MLVDVAPTLKATWSSARRKLTISLMTIGLKSTESKTKVRKRTFWSRLIRRLYYASIQRLDCHLWSIWILSLLISVTLTTECHFKNKKKEVEMASQILKVSTQSTEAAEEPSLQEAARRILSQTYSHHGCIHSTTRWREVCIWSSSFLMTRIIKVYLIPRLLRNLMTIRLIMSHRHGLGQDLLEREMSYRLITSHEWNLPRRRRSLKVEEEEQSRQESMSVVLTCNGHSRTILMLRRSEGVCFHFIFSRMIRVGSIQLTLNIQTSVKIFARTLPLK